MHGEVMRPRHRPLENWEDLTPRRSWAHASTSFSKQSSNCSQICFQSVPINLRTISRSKTWAQPGKRTIEKRSKIRIEDQQLTGKVDLETTWEQNPPKTG